MKEAGFRQAVMGRYPSETVDVEATDDNTLLFTNVPVWECSFDLYTETLLN